MTWSDFTPYIGAVLLFLAMQVAPSLKTFTDHLVLVRAKKKDRDAETSATRADEAAKVCFEELATLHEAIPAYARLRYAALKQEETQPRDEARAVHDGALARLEANITLLPPEIRVAMARVLSVLRYAYDLPMISGMRHQGYHPESAFTIAGNLVRQGREVLASHLRREPLRPEPDVIAEYRLALEDREDELSNEFAEEIYEEQAALRTFRTSHNLPSERAPWPDRNA